MKPSYKPFLIPKKSHIIPKAQRKFKRSSEGGGLPSAGRHTGSAKAVQRPTMLWVWVCERFRGFGFGVSIFGVKFRACLVKSLKG